MRTALAALGLMVSVAGFSCSKEEAPKPDNAKAKAASSAATTASAKPADKKPVKDTRPDAPPFKLVEKPSASDVTEGAVKGSANGKVFEVKAVVIQPGSKPSKKEDQDKKRWRISLYDKPLEKPTGHISKAQAINITLNEEPKKGAKIVKEKKYGDGYFQIQKPDDEVGKTTSWNANNAYYIEFTEWDVKEYDEKDKMFQVAGKASGKIYVVYEASKGSKFKHSGAAGEFKDATVRYMGKPYWLKKDK